MPRKPLPLDADQVFRLAKLGCTTEEIGDILGCSHDTISRRFENELTRARAERKMSLRRAQFVRATKDRSDTMLIHLGKTELNQGEKMTGAQVKAKILFETIDDGRDPDLPPPGEAT